MAKCTKVMFQLYNLRGKWMIKAAVSWIVCVCEIFSCIMPNSSPSISPNFCCGYQVYKDKGNQLVSITERPSWKSSGRRNKKRREGLTLHASLACSLGLHLCLGLLLSLSPHLSYLPLTYRSLLCFISFLTLIINVIQNKQGKDLKKYLLVYNSG